MFPGSRAVQSLQWINIIHCSIQDKLLLKYAKKLDLVNAFNSLIDTRTSQNMHCPRFLDHPCIGRFFSKIGLFALM